MQRKVGTISVMLPLYFIMVSVINAEVKFLGGSCAKDVDCSIAFSECANSICACRAGFQASDDGLCKPRTISCPLGEVDARTAKRCAVSVAFGSSNSVARGDCDADSFCLAIWYSSQLQKDVGYCCKKPVSTCLFGTPVLNVTCDPGYNADIYSAPQWNNFMYSTGGQRSCNYTTHYCFVSPALSKSFVQGLCCPRPCSTGMINVNGTCYPTVKTGESCLVNEQCPTFSQCTVGTCICKKRYVDTADGYCTVPYCPDREFDYDDRNSMITVNLRRGRSPRFDANGTIVRCKDSNCPGIGEFCEPSRMVCCSVPDDAFCYVRKNSTETVANVSSSSEFRSVPPQKMKAVAADTSIRCNPYQSTYPFPPPAKMPVKYKICPDNGECIWWYQSHDHDANGTVQIGYCCPQLYQTPQHHTSLAFLY